MKRFALAALVVMGLQAFPASAAPLPVDTNPLGTLKSNPANADQQAPAGAFRLVVVFDNSVKPGSQVPTGPATGGNVPLLANGDFGVRFTGGSIAGAPQPGLMVGHSARLDDVKSAADGMGADALPGGGFPADASNAVNGVAGFVPDGACPSGGGAPLLWAYSTSTTTTGPGPLSAAPCQTVTNTLNADGITFTRTVTTWTPGFYVDFKVPSGGAWAQSAFMYKAVFDSEGEADDDFWNTADMVGTATWTK
ncbi:MAG: hypothetical protein QOG04_1033 [Actinomycetota bacterium]|jgi:hypothetical protein|nr:hypothetical protein [Actinomycetota bacterium]